MVTNEERIDAETRIRKLREEREYNEKVAALLEDKKKEQIKRQKPAEFFPIHPVTESKRQYNQVLGNGQPPVLHRYQFQPLHYLQGRCHGCGVHTVFLFSRLPLTNMSSRKIPAPTLMAMSATLNAGQWYLPQ